VEDLISDFKKILKMSEPSTSQTWANKRSQLSHNIKSVEDYQIEIIDPSINCDTFYEIIKSVREYKGEEDKYVI